VSGETTERPFSRTILGAISATCFTLFGAGLVLWMQTVTIGALRAYTFLVIMTVVFLLSMMVAAQSGRYSASSYGWKQWTAVVIPILLLVRITAFFGSGTDGFEDPIRFISGLLDLTSIILAFVLALTWAGGMRVARNIELLHPQRSEVPPSIRSPQYYEWLDSRDRYIDRAAAIGELTQLAAIGGGILIGFTAFSVAIGAEQQNAGLVQTSLAIMVLYYMSVLVLLSYANLIRYTSQWSLELASQAPGLTGTWIRSAFVLLVVALVLAMLVPAIDTDAFVNISRLIFEVMIWIFRIVLVPGLLVIGFFARLFDFFRPTGEKDHPDPPPAPQFGNPTTSALDPTAVLAALVVLVIGGLAIYWFTGIVRRNFHNIEAEKAGHSVLGHLLLILRAVLGSIIGMLRWSRTVGRVLGGQIKVLAFRRTSTEATTPEPRSHRSDRTVQQHIHQIYAAVVTEASSLGIQRKPGATPAEYEDEISLQCQGATVALQQLTEMYIIARYSTKDPHPHALEQARQIQAGILDALRSRDD
jgi:hypothetical protein